MEASISVKDIVESSISLLGYKVLEYHSANVKGIPTVRVTIIHPNHSISTSDCASVGDTVSKRLFVECGSQYSIIIESAGIDREIKNNHEYDYLINKEFEIFLDDYKSLNMTNHFIGTLIGVDETSLTFEGESIGIINLEKNSINKAKLHCDFTKILRDHKYK